MEVIGPVCVMIQLEAFIMPILATVLQLKEQFKQYLCGRALETCAYANTPIVGKQPASDYLK